MFPQIQMKGVISFPQPTIVLPSKLHLSSSSGFKCRCSIACPTSVGVAPRDPDKLSARERRKLRNERREQVKGSKLSWREEVENKLLEKVKKPKSWMDEMNLNHLAVKGPQWWMIMTPRNSEKVVIDQLSTTFPIAFPDVEFQVYLPQLPFRRKLKDGSYSETKKKLFPGWVFIRCPMNREIHEFVRNCSGVRGFFGTKIGNVFRQMVKPSAVPIAEMEAIYKQVKEAQEEYECAIEDARLKEERNNEVEHDSAGQDEMLEDFEGGNPSREENANHYQDFVTEFGIINTSGKQIGSLGKMKATSKKLLKTSTDYTGHVNELSVKGSKKNKSSIRRDDLSRKQDSIHLVTGSTVRITSGPFAEFSGHLKEFNGETLKAKVLLTMFGHETLVDLDVNQLEYEASKENRKP